LRLLLLLLLRSTRYNITYKNAISKPDRFFSLFYFPVILFYIIYHNIIVIIFHCGTSKTVFPFAADDSSYPPATIVVTGARACVCVCAFAPRARSTWDRSVAVAVNLVKFPVARRRRRSAVYTTPPLPRPPPLADRRHRPAPPPPPTRDSKRYRPPRVYDKNGDEKLSTSFAVRKRPPQPEKSRISRTRHIVRSPYDDHGPLTGIWSSFGFHLIVAVNAAVTRYTK